jgi:hypothetical protein
MEKSMTLSQLFECGIAAENAARDFYLGLIQKFSSQPVVSAFWKTMSDDEESHARTLEKARNSMSGDKLAGFVDAAMAEKARALRKLSVPEMLDSIHNLNDAYLLAHELESSDINTVFNFLKLKLVPESEKTSLSPDVIERHLNKLIDFPKTFGDAPMRKSIDIDA